MTGTKKFLCAVLAAALAAAALLLPLRPTTAYAATASVQLPEKKIISYAERVESKEELFSHKATFRTDETSLKYRCYLPEVTDGAPLVLFLHGGGERGTDNDRQLDNAILLPFIEDEDSPFYSAVVVAPQCPAKENGDGWGDMREHGYDIYANYSVDEVPESAECRALVGLINEMVTRYSLDTSRVYVIGVSQGAVAVWDLLARHGELFAAAVPIAGGGDVSKAEIYADIPIYAFHGAMDFIVPYDKGTPRLYEAVDAVGKGKMNFVSFSDGVHDIWDQSIIYAGGNGMPSLAEWLFSQKKEVEGTGAVIAICVVGAVVLTGIAVGVALVADRKRSRESSI